MNHSCLGIFFWYMFTLCTISRKSYPKQWSVTNFALYSRHNGFPVGLWLLKWWCQWKVSMLWVLWSPIPHGKSWVWWEHQQGGGHIALWPYPNRAQNFLNGQSGSPPLKQQNNDLVMDHEWRSFSQGGTDGLQWATIISLLLCWCHQYWCWFHHLRFFWFPSWQLTDWQRFYMFLLFSQIPPKHSARLCSQNRFGKWMNMITLW